MGSFSTLGGGIPWGQIKQKLESEGVFNVADLLHAYALYKAGAKTIDEIAVAINDMNADVVAAEIEGRADFADFIDFLANVFNNAIFSADKVASIFDSDNLSVDKVASICDSPNISSSKLKAILDTGKLTNVDKIAAILDGDSLTADDAASHINAGVYTDDLYASAFDSSYLLIDKAASILNSGNLSIDKAVSILNNANLSADKATSILNNANLSADKAASILTDPNLSQARFDSIWQNISDARRNDMLDSYYWAVINPWCQEKYKEHINGGFETGDFTGWTTEGGYCSVKTDYVKEGTYACAVDRGAGTGGTIRIYRTIKVPYRKDTNNKLYLHYWVKRWKNTDYASKAKIKINGNDVYAIPYDNTWYERLEDITNYEGQSITVELYVNVFPSTDHSCYVRWDDIYVVEGS